MGWGLACGISLNSFPILFSDIKIHTLNQTRMKRQGFSHLKSNENYVALKQRDRSSIAIVIDFNRYLISTSSSVCRTLSRSLAYIVNWIIFNTGKRRNMLSIFEVP